MLARLLKYSSFLLAFLLSSTLFAQEISLEDNSKIVLKLKTNNTALFLNKTTTNNFFKKIEDELSLKSFKQVFPSKNKSKEIVDLSLIYTLNYHGKFSNEQIVDKLRQTKLFEYVELLSLPKLAYTPNDTDVFDQYYLNLIDAFNAWDLSNGDTNVVIGITDTGWDPSHPDLLGNVKFNYSDPINGIDDDGDGYEDNFMGWDLGMNDNDATYESTSHGVNVVGVASAETDNVTGIAGVGFKTKFLPIKISNSAGLLTHAYEGIVYAADRGCKVINCSWGSYEFSQYHQDVVDYALSKGCIIVAAAGNNNSENVFYPAGYKGVVECCSN